MNNKSLTAVLSMMIIIIAFILAIFIVKTIDKKKSDPIPETGQITQTVPDSNPPENNTEIELPTGNDQPSDDNDPSEDEQPVQNEEPDEDKQPDDNDTPVSNDDTDDDTQNTPSNEGGSSGVASGSVGMPSSYKEFSLTKDMSAKEAYEFLNSFLESKYSLLTNKQNKVSSDYEPTDLAVPSGCEYKMERTAGNALVEMLADAKSAGYSDLILYSGYRTYASQKNKYETRTQKYLDQGYSQEQAEAKAGEYIAPPGSSEHHTGLAADVCSSKIVSKYGYLSEEFDSTAEFKWLSNHCAEYGFILRYRADAEDITGFLYEPWHYRYIGVDHAVACTELGITYEEYHEMIVKFKNEAKADA